MDGREEDDGDTGLGDMVELSCDLDSGNGEFTGEIVGERDRSRQTFLFSFTGSSQLGADGMLLAEDGVGLIGSSIFLLQSLIGVALELVRITRKGRLLGASI